MMIPENFLTSNCFVFFLGLEIELCKEVVHSGHQLPYLLGDSMHYMTLKTLQPGHWEVKEFFYAKLGTFRDLQRAP